MSDKFSTNIHLYAYEFVRDGSANYFINNRNFSLDDQEELIDPTVLFMVNIKKNEKQEDGSCNDGHSLRYDDNIKADLNYKSRSCDPLVFQYSDNYSCRKVTKEEKEYYCNDVINNYTYDEKHYNHMLEVLCENNDGLRLENNDITEFIAGCLILPEMGTISAFGDVPEDNYTILTSNLNLKCHHINGNKFKEVVDEFTNSYKKQIGDLDKTGIEDEEYEEDEDEDSKIDYSEHIKLITDENVAERDTYGRQYLQKKIVDNNSEMCFIGDIHGSIHSLIRILLRLVSIGKIDKSWKFNKNFFLVFLGDLVDRSVYGVEVVYLVMKLKIENKDNVIIIKGNHEDCHLSSQYLLQEEFSKIPHIVIKKIEKINNTACNHDKYTKKKVDKETELYTKYCKAMQHLPVAVFIKTISMKSYIQLCHAGINHKINVKEFLDDKTESSFFHVRYDYTRSFQWNKFTGIERDDFEKYLSSLNLTSEEQLKYRTSSSGYDVDDGYDPPNNYWYSYVLTFLKDNNICAVIRGHDDQYHNTKLVEKGEHDLISIEEYKNENSFKLKKYENNTLYKIPLPDNKDQVDNYSTKYNILPVITLSTGMPSRFIDADGFGIINFGENEQGGGHKYLKYKNKYLDIKRRIK